MQLIEVDGYWINPETITHAERIMTTVYNHKDFRINFTSGNYIDVCKVDFNKKIRGVIK